MTVTVVGVILVGVLIRGISLLYIIYIYIYVCMYVCMYVYIYIYIICDSNRGWCYSSTFTDKGYKCILKHCIYAINYVIK